MTPTLDILRHAPLHRVTAHDRTIVAAIGVGLLTLGWLILEHTTHRVPAWERALFRRLNDLPDWLRVPLWPPMQLGNFWAWIVAAPILVAIYRRAAPAITVAIACAGAWAFAKLIKSIVDRGRPLELLPHAIVREAGIHGQGFVSGHAAVAAALATALSPWLPRPLIVVAWILVGVVGVARIYFGAHLPLDIVGGIGVGLVFGAVAGAIVGIPAT